MSDYRDLAFRSPGFAAFLDEQYVYMGRLLTEDGCECGVDAFPLR
jgi:hypothetical protein